MKFIVCFIKCKHCLKDFSLFYERVAIYVLKGDTIQSTYDRGTKAMTNNMYATNVCTVILKIYLNLLLVIKYKTMNKYSFLYLVFILKIV